MSRVGESEDIIQSETLSDCCKLTKRGKRKISNSFARMLNMRVIQKHLVYVIGLSAELAFKDVIIKIIFDV
jgi:hypothetical protein